MSEVAVPESAVAAVLKSGQAQSSGEALQIVGTVMNALVKAGWGPREQVLGEEADWLDTSVANAQRLIGRYSRDLLSGFEMAAGWVRFHANHDRSLATSKLKLREYLFERWLQDNPRADFDNDRDFAEEAYLAGMTEAKRRGVEL